MDCIRLHPLLEDSIDKVLVHSLPEADEGRSRGQVFPRASPIVFEVDATRWPASMRANSYSALLKPRSVDVEDSGLVRTSIPWSDG